MSNKPLSEMTPKEKVQAGIDAARHKPFTQTPVLIDEELEEAIRKDYEDFRVRDETGYIQDILIWTREAQRDASDRNRDKQWEPMIEEAKKQERDYIRRIGAKWPTKTVAQIIDLIEVNEEAPKGD